MPSLMLKKCCFCVDLRIGCIIAGFLLLLSKLGWLVTVIIQLAHMIQAMSLFSDNTKYLSTVMVGTVSLMAVDLFLCVVLMIGLVQKVPPAVKVFYIGAFTVMLLNIMILVSLLSRFGDNYNAQAWILGAAEVVFYRLPNVYFIVVIRSYYYKLKNEIRESNVNQNVRMRSTTLYTTQRHLVEN